MKKSFKLQNLGCANCAARMEADIAKLNGVEHAQISFMTSKLTVETSRENWEPLLQEMQRIVSSYEDDCVIVHK